MSKLIIFLEELWMYYMDNHDVWSAIEIENIINSIYGGIK